MMQTRLFQSNNIFFVESDSNFTFNPKTKNTPKENCTKMKVKTMSSQTKNEEFKAVVGHVLIDQYLLFSLNATTQQSNEIPVLEL